MSKELIVNSTSLENRLAIVEDPSSGALLSGGVLDMIAVKHTPVRPVPLARLSEASLHGTSMAVNVDPESISPGQKEALRAFTKGGGTLLTAPPGWKIPAPAKDQITLDKKQLDQIDDIWKGINSMIGRTNLGARLFNVSGMLSSRASIRSPFSFRIFNSQVALICFSRTVL